MNKQIMEIHAEEISIAKEIETTLQKENVTENILSELKNKYQGLKINGLEDKEGYDAVHKARMECARLRGLTVKICKKGRERANDISKAWISEEKRVVSRIKEVEDVLAQEQKKIDDETERLKISAMEKEKARLQAIEDEKRRLQDLELQKERDRLAEENRIQQEAIDKAKKELEEKEAAFRKQQEEADRKIKADQEKIAADNKRMNEEKLNLRLDRMHEIGLRFNGQSYIAKGIDIPMIDFRFKTDDEFNNIIVKYKARIEQNKQDELKEEARQQEVQEQKEIEDARIAEENRIAREKELAKEKEEARLQGIEEERLRAEKEANEKIEAERLAKEEEERAAALLPDKNKIRILIGEILAIASPELKSAKAKELVRTALVEISAIATKLDIDSKKLK
jgi:hypothetical protein